MLEFEDLNNMKAQRRGVPMEGFTEKNLKAACSCTYCLAMYVNTHGKNDL